MKYILDQLKVCTPHEVYYRPAQSIYAVQKKVYHGQAMYAVQVYSVHTDRESRWK